MKNKISESNYSILVENTTGTCSTGERISKQNIEEGKIPVLSCEGACIRGEIARLAANMITKKKSYSRACHGELLAVPHSTMTQWVKEAEKVVLIDGCFLHCHARIFKNMIGEDKLIQFDALSIYKKYTQYFNIDDVSESERKEAARQVAEKVINSMENLKKI